MVKVEISKKGVEISNTAGKKAGSFVSTMFKSAIGDLQDASNEKKLAVGATAGIVAGYVTSKFGKVAATCIGGGFLILQVARYNNYIEVDMKKVNQDMGALRANVERNSGKVPQIINSIKVFASENVVLAGGFASGFLLGFAFS